MAGQRGRRATGMTSRSEVWVAENEATLLSTSPASFAASITSTSHNVAAFPHAAFNDILDAKFPSHITKVNRRASKLERRVPRDDEQLSEAR